MRAGRINYDDIVFYLVNVTSAQTISPSHFPIIINYRIDCITRPFYFKSARVYNFNDDKNWSARFFYNANVSTQRE